MQFTQADVSKISEKEKKRLLENIQGALCAFDGYGSLHNPRKSVSNIKIPRKIKKHVGDEYLTMAHHANDLTKFCIALAVKIYKLNGFYDKAIDKIMRKFTACEK